VFGITWSNKPRGNIEELKVNITDAIQLMLAAIYEEAHEKKKMEIEVTV
jgi:hypothetical protein